VTDAAKQLAPTSTYEPSVSSVTLPSDRALSRSVGGTGASVSTVAQLCTHLGAEQVSAKGAASGYTPLDSGVLVPLAYLREFTGASFGGAGAAGQVPAPAAAKHRGVLRGDKTWTDQNSGDVSITRVVDDQSTPAAADLQVAGIAADGGQRTIRIATQGDGADKLIATSAAGGGYKARIGTQATGTDEYVDLQLEPTPFKLGDVTVYGDPVARTLRPWRWIVAEAMGTTFHTFGLPTPTVDTPGSAAASYIADGFDYVSLSYDGATSNSECGLFTGVVTRRSLNPDYLAFFDHNAQNGRVWYGLFSASPTALDPSGDDPLAGSTVSGVGFWWDATVHSGSGFLRAVASDGTTQTQITTGIPITGAEPIILRVRHDGQAAGVWHFAYWDYTLGTWSNQETMDLSGGGGPGATTGLAIFHRQRTLNIDSTDRANRVRLIGIR